MLLLYIINYIITEIFVLYLTGTSKQKLPYRKETEVRTTLQELLLYLIFLINLCICKYANIKILIELEVKT